MKLIVSVLFLAITSVLKINSFEYLVNSYEGDSQKIAYALGENVELLNEYNKAIGYTTKITGVESIKKVIITQHKKVMVGYLTDFNSDEGYYLLADDNIMFDWVIGEESPFHQYDSNYKFYYNVYTGYYYEDENDIMYSVDEQKNILPSDSNGSYLGQETNVEGYGKIFDTNLYIIDKYDSGYKLESENSLDYITNLTQMDLSVYLKHDAGKVYSEGNCGVVSVYNAVQAMQSLGLFARMEASYTRAFYNPIVDESDIHGQYIFQGSNYVNSIPNGTNWPVLYINVRREAINIKGKPEGLTIYQSATLMEEVASLYNYSINCSVKLAYQGKFDEVMQNIDSFQASLFSTASGTYENHTMCITGYKTYKKETKVLGITSVKKVLFYELQDGYATNVLYYDISAYNGIGAIVVIE